MVHVVECFGEPFDGPWSFGWLVLDQGEPGLDLFPKGSFASLPDASGFRGH